jgi:hypothetical protein
VYEQSHYSVLVPRKLSVVQRVTPWRRAPRPTVPDRYWSIVAWYDGGTCSHIVVSGVS